MSVSDDYSIEAVWEEMRDQLEKNGYTKRDPKEMMGEKLKDFREKKNMSIPQAAKKSGFSTGTISHYENGKTVPTLEDLQVLLLTYDVTLYDFFGIEKADYEDDCNVFKRYGLSETFYRELFFAKTLRTHNDIADCINLIFDCPFFASTLFEELACFFNASYHEQVDRIPIPVKLLPDASIRLLLEPVIHTLGNIFNAKYPGRQKGAISSLLGQEAASQVEAQAKLFEEVKKHEKQQS